MSQIFDGSVRFAFLDEFRSMPTAAQFYLPATFAIPPARTLRFFSGVPQDCADGHVDLKPRHRFCTAVQMEMAHRVTDGIADVFAARERLQLLDKPTVAALSAFDRLLMQFFRPSLIVGEVLEQQCCYSALSGRHCMNA